MLPWLKPVNYQSFSQLNDISWKDNRCRIIDDSGDYGCYVDVDPNVNCTEYWPFIARDCPRYQWKSCDISQMPDLEPEPCEERQSWTYQGQGVDGQFYRSHPDLVILYSFGSKIPVRNQQLQWIWQMVQHFSLISMN